MLPLRVLAGQRRRQVRRHDPALRPFQARCQMQFVEAVEWIPRFNVNYLLGIDGISLLFVLLNSFITVVVVWAGWVVIQTRVANIWRHS
jgi:NADH:ubiquinone oxidoreductase subunit 4 (subunit M)